MNLKSVLNKLLDSENPSVVYRMRRNFLNESEKSRKLRNLKREIRESGMAQQLLHTREKDGTIATNPYRKWQGPHWTLFSLAEIDYPEGDNSLIPIRDQVYEWLLSPSHLEFPRSLLIPGQENRFRRCASQEGNAVWYSIKLGLVDERTQILVDRLIQWQWPDGGWNCDKRPAARTSSFCESLIPLRGLHLFGKTFNDEAALAASEKTAEFLLKRHLFKRLRDGKVALANFIKINYPVSFYDFLAALKVMAEMGKIQDKRCADALDLLQTKQLPDGGFPLEMKNAKTTDKIETRGSYADWGPSGKTRMNEFITADAFGVLKAAGRI